MKQNPITRRAFALSSIALTALALSSFGTVAAAEQQLLKPDGKPADMKKPVKVFILMGQSNMVGMGDISGGGGAWTSSILKPVLSVYEGAYTSKADYDNMKPVSTTELKTMGEMKPPTSPGEYTAVVRGQIQMKAGQYQFASGYKDSPASWAKGTEPKPIEWYAGKQYDDDMADAKAALADLAKIYPGYQEGQGYEIAGFVWWQGHKDQMSSVYASRYEQNLVNLIKSLRKDYNAPNARFVLAVGCGNPGRTGLGLQVAEAQLAMNDARKHPEFSGNVKCVDSRDFWREVAVSPKDQGHHYNRNAETYMEVGLSLGQAMAELFKK